MVIDGRNCQSIRKGVIAATRKMDTFPRKACTEESICAVVLDMEEGTNSYRLDESQKGRKRP